MNWPRFGLIILLLMVAVVAGVTWGYLPPKNFPPEQVVEIEPGLDLGAVARLLHRQGVISSPLFFKLTLRVRGESGQVIAGLYQFARPLSSWAVAERVRAGEFVAEPVKLTIPEGLAAQAVTALVHEALPTLDQSAFLALAKSNQGRLFPATYALPSRVSVPQLITLLRQRFDQEIQKLMPTLAASGRSLSELVILASLVEEEASEASDRRLIADILWRRLDARQRLEVDVEPGTYDYFGLPDQPIVNPGRDALQAALAPTASDYWFYLSDRNGVIHYAKSFAEHQKNIDRYLK